MQALFC